MTTISGNLHNGAQWRDVTKQNHGSPKGMEDSVAFFQPSPPNVLGKEEASNKQLPKAPEPDRYGVAPPNKKDGLEIGLPYDPLPDLNVTQPYEAMPELQLTLPYESVSHMNIGLPYNPFPDLDLVALRKPIFDLHSGSLQEIWRSVDHSASGKETTKVRASLTLEPASKLALELATQMIKKEERTDSGLGE